MAREGHQLPKELLGPTMPNPSTPFGQVTPETVFSGIAHLEGRQPAAIFNPFGHPMLHAYDHDYQHHHPTVHRDKGKLKNPSILKMSFKTFFCFQSKLSLENSGRHIV
jgi:hypothetical protein